jgi:ATP-dependent RNA helicase DBP3
MVNPPPPPPPPPHTHTHTHALALPNGQCWPILMAGRDIIGIAETGSGKTLTFSLPGLCRVRTESAKGGRKNATRMLVVAPTRELAMQSQEVLDAVLAAKGLKGAFRSVCLFGGVPKHEQRKALRAGVDVIVATPGRLVDLMEEGECDLSQVTYLVLDEVSGGLGAP